MRMLKYITLFVVWSQMGFAQSMDNYLLTVEQHNPRLVAMQKWLSAEEARSRSGIYPDNPEVSYNYLFGSPETIGNQQEFEVIQSFKLPGYYTSKAEIQQIDYQQKEALAEKVRREVMYEAQVTWLNLVWLTKKEALLKTRFEDAEKLVSLMKEGFEAGEVAKPAYDKARLYAISIQTALQKVNANIHTQRQYLWHLNGGTIIEDLALEYPVAWQLPALDSILASLSADNPDLIVAQLAMAQTDQQVKHQRMNSMPSFEAGYKSETILDQRLQGIHAGISIPLWQHKNTVKYARMQNEWSEAHFVQQQSELSTELTSLYQKADVLLENYQQMSSIMEEEQISATGLELLESGQINFTDFLVQADLIAQNQLVFYEMEKDYYLALSALKQLIDYK